MLDMVISLGVAAALAGVSSVGIGVALFKGSNSDDKEVNTSVGSDSGNSLRGNNAVYNHSYNKLFLLPDGVVRPYYSILFYTLLYEIKNKVELGRDKYVSPTTGKVISKEDLKVPDDYLIKMSRDIAVTRELNAKEVNNWVKKLDDLARIKSNTLKNDFIKEYMERTRPNRLKYADNSDLVLIGGGKVRQLMDSEMNAIYKQEEETLKLLNNPTI